MFVAWMTRHMTSKHILLRQQITMGAERQHFQASHTLTDNRHIQK